MLQGALVRMARSAITTALAAWWASKQADPRWLAAIPVIHGAFKLLRDKFPTNQILNALPF